MKIPIDHLMEVISSKRAIIIWAVAIMVYYCWFQTFYNAVRFGSMLPYEDLHDLFLGVVKNFIPNLILSVTDIFIVFRLTVRLSLGRKIVTDLMMSLMATFSIGMLYMVVAFVLGQIREIDFSKTDWIGIVLNDITIFMCLELVYYFTMILRYRKETEDARHLALQYQYDALKAQINPHFLFNSLNLLCSIVAVDSSKAEHFIRELSRMYRYVMAQQNRELVALKEELDFLSSYVSVLEMRYAHKFHVNITGTPADDMYVIPFSMQLLIENVTKHNIISSSCPMEVSVVIHDDCLTVSNPIRKRDSESVSKIGLHYLSKLYAAKGYDFYTRNDGECFYVNVPIIIQLLS